MTDGPGGRTLSRELRAWQTFVRGEAHVLSRFPELVWQIAANQPATSVVAGHASQRQAEGRWITRPWLRLVNRRARASACLLTLRCEGDPADVALSPDGQHLIVAEKPAWITPDAGGLSTWDAIAGRKVHDFPVVGGIDAVAIMPDGRRLICATGGAARLFDLDAGTFTTAFAPPAPHRITTVAVSPDGGLVAGSGSRHDNGVAIPIHIWDAESGACVMTMVGHERSVSAVRFTQDGTRLISSGSVEGLGAGSRVRVWDCRSGSMQAEFSFPDGRINDLALSACGCRLAVCGRGFGGGPRIWDLESGQETRLAERFDATVLTFTPDGRSLVLGHDDGDLVFFDATSGEETGRLFGHQRYVRAIVVVPDGRRAVSCSEDRTVKVWDLALAGKREDDERSQHRFGVRALRFSPDGATVSLCGDEAEMVWSCETGRPLGERPIACQMEGSRRISDGWSDVSQTPDGSRTAVLRLHRDARVFKSGSIGVREEKTHDVRRILGAQKMNIWFGRPEITSDGERVIAVLGDREVFVRKQALVQWHVESGAVMRCFTFSGTVVSLQLLPDAGGVFLAFGDGWLTSLDLNSFRVTQDLRHNTQLVEAVVTPDGRRIVSAGQDRTMVVWDRSSGKPMARHVGSGGFGFVAVSDRMVAILDGGDVVILELMGITPGPRPVVELRDGDRRFWVCPYCGTQSACAQPPGGSVSCESCRGVATIVRVPPPPADLGAGTAIAAAELEAFIPSPEPASAPPPHTEEPASWLERLLTWIPRGRSASGKR